MDQTNAIIYTDRVENKYIVALSDVDEIIEVIEDHCEIDFPKKDTEYTLIRSNYLDTPEFKFLKDHLDDKSDRYKLRIRTYAPNGVWGDEKFLEVKYKLGEVKKKERIRINEQSIIQVLGGLPLPEKLNKINKDVPEASLDHCISLINTLTAPGLNFITNVSYRRLSYANSKVKVTIDTKVKVQPCAVAKKYDPSDDIRRRISEVGNKFNADTQSIVEVKFAVDDEAPPWAEKLVKKFKQDSEGFSKYLWGLNEALK